MPHTISGTRPRPAKTIRGHRLFIVLLSLLVCVSVVSRTTAAIDDYVAYWSFDEGVGDTAHDSSANGFDGQVFGAGWTDGIVGSGLSFDDTARWVDITDDAGYPDLIGDLPEGTISVWFKINRITDTNENLPIFYLGDGIGGDGHSGLIIEVGHFGIDSRLYFTIFTDDKFIPLCFDSGSDLAVGQWYHFAAVIGPDFNTGYLNGQEMVSRHYNYGGPAERYFFADVLDKRVCWVGRGFLSDITTEQYFDGVIDEIRVYDRPLSGGEINDYYESIAGTSGDFVEITSPSDGQTVSGTIEVAGISQGMDSGRVWVSIDGGAYQLAMGTNTWSYTWDTTAYADGPHDISARARACRSCTFVYDTISVDVDNSGSSLQIEISSPGDADVLWGPTTIFGTSTGADAVEIAIDSGTFEPASGTTDWSYTFDASLLTESDHSLTARATNGVGDEVLQTTYVIINHDSPPVPDCGSLVVGDPLPFTNPSAPPFLHIGLPQTVYIEIIGHSENRGYDGYLQNLLDANPPGGHNYVVTNHWIGGHETWRWVTPGQAGYDAIEDIINNIQGPTIALILTSNNATYPAGASDMSDPNYARFVNECTLLADHLINNGLGVDMCYFSAHRMKPQNLMPCWYENLAIEDLLAIANSEANSRIKAGPAQHDLHWCCYPACYDADFSHTNDAGDALMAQTWHEFLLDRISDCAGDFDGSGTINSQDFVAFLNAFVANDRHSDFNGDGSHDSQDFVAFLNAFVAGCG